MEENKNTARLFHVEIAQGIYLISDLEQGPTEDGKSLAPGNATANSYLIIGEEKALLFDLAVNSTELKTYAEKLAGKPVQLVLSHGHYDHAFYLNKYQDVWMNTKDEFLLKKGMLGFPPVEPCPIIHGLEAGDVIDLGGRELEVFHIPGHTPGSILLLDRKCRVLLSGDTCARRLLYGLHEQVSFEEFCASLENLKTADFDVMYSAHDRCAIPKEYLSHMMLLLKNEVPQTKNVVDLPGIGEMKCFFHGDIRTLDYFDIAFMEEPIKDISKIRLNVQ